LGQFNLPVTITPTSDKVFFIDPVNGEDTSEGTAAEPWKFVKNVFDITQATGSRVFRAASAGNDVVVTILAGGTETGIASNISTPNLPAGSVTVLKAPSAETFTLNMGNRQLTLNKGYRLQDIKIDFNFGTGAGTGVTIAHPTAGLASVEVTCDGTGATCVKVTGAGSHTLRDVTVKVEASSGSNVGIQNDANANLSIVGGRVELTGNGAGITLINAQGVLTATGLTVDMTGRSPEHTQGSKGIVLNAARSLVTGSTIRLNRPANSGVKAIGIDVQANALSSIVEGNTFLRVGGSSGSGNAIGVGGASRLSSLSRNTFEGFGGTNDKAFEP